MRLVASAVAGVAAVLAYALPLKLNIVAAIAIAVIFCLTLERFQPNQPTQGRA
jgi:hypothetical protein